MISECPINMGCKVIKEVDIYEMDVFIGQVIDVYVNKDCLSNGFPDIEKS